MSTTIDYRRKAYRYEDAYGSRCFVVLAETGDSNMFDMWTGQPSRRWHVLFHGPAYAVYQEIPISCAYVSGCSLRLVGHRTTGDHAEDVVSAIRRYDRTLKAAQPLEALFREHSLQGVIDLTGEITNKYAAERLSDYVSKYGLTFQETSYYGKPIRRAQIAIQAIHQLLDTLAARHCGDQSIDVRIQISQELVQGATKS
jgi:hypothetical protein